jgi:hypothetical protein
MPSSQFRQRIAVTLAVAVLLAGVALAAEPSPAAPATQDDESWFVKVFDSTLGLVLLFIFLPVVVTTLLAARQRDRCLKTFHKYFAAVTRLNEAPVWGTARVFSKGLVLAYRDPVRHPAAPTKTSFMMFEPDLAKIHAVYRYHDTICEENRRRRTRQVRRMARPNLLRRLWRRTRNLINSLRDAFGKAIGAILGQMQKTKPKSRVLATGGKPLESVGTTIFGHVANAYEPLLEAHIAKPVVLELAGPAEGQLREYGGVLGEYSAGYVMVLNVDAEVTDTATAHGPGAFEGQVAVREDADGLVVENGLSVPVRVDTVEVDGAVTGMETVVPPNETTRLELRLSELRPSPPGSGEGETAPEPAAPTPIRLTFVARRAADIIAPRTHAVVRHGGAQEGELP